MDGVDGKDRGDASQWPALQDSFLGRVEKSKGRGEESRHSETGGWKRNCLELGEGEGHGVDETVEDVDLLLAGEDEFDGMSVFLELEEGLATDATGGCRFLDKVATREGCDGDSLDGNAREIGTGSIERGTLATNASKGRILLISTYKDLAVVEFQRCSDLEITVW